MRSLRLAALAATLLASTARAQCPTWLPGDPLAGTDGTLYAATAWDPDGPGPLAPRLVVGGEFTAAGDVVTENVATLDPATGRWSALGAGLPGDKGLGAVTAFAALPGGDLLAGGSFVLRPGSPPVGLARWDGSAWAALGDCPVQAVRALAVLPTGDIVAAGTLAAPIVGSGPPIIARWDGSAWSTIATPLGGVASALAVTPDGALIAAGRFTSIGGVQASRIARWDGSAWSPLGAGLGGDARALAVLPSGDLIAAGVFISAGGAPAARVARWDGSAWSPLGAGMNGTVNALAVLPSGDIVAAGLFSRADDTPTGEIARWDGVGWRPLGAGIPYVLTASTSAVNALAAFPNGELFAAGSFPVAGGLPVRSLAKWDGAEWSLPSPGTAGTVLAITPKPDGGLIAGGAFSRIGGAPASNIAHWDGAAWTAMGTGTNDAVRAVAILPDGGVVAGGSFTTAGGQPASRVARWDGSAWAPMGAGMDATVRALAVLPTGDVVAAGSFTTAGGTPAGKIARWDGSAWTPIGTGVTAGGGTVYALAVMPNGDLVAGGDFTSMGGAQQTWKVARWNGTAWGHFAPSALPSSSFSAVLALAVLPGGDLVAGGSFEGFVSRSDGSAWSRLGAIGDSGNVRAIATTPSGEVIAAGNFLWVLPGQTPIPLFAIARWTGSTWSTVGSGLLGPYQGVSVAALATLPSGELAAGGDIALADGRVSAGFARYSFTGAPAIARQPADQTITPGQTLVLSATPSPGYAGLTVQWRRDGVPVADGPGGASPAGGAVSGATAALPSPTTGQPATLTITGAQPSDTGGYTAVFSGPCGQATTREALVSVPACYPNCDGSTGAPTLNALDFSCFLARYRQALALPAAQQQAAYANCDASTTFPELNALDFACFLQRYRAGCP